MLRTSGQRARGPIVLGHHQGVAAAAGRERDTLPGTSADGASQAMIYIDPFRVGAEHGQRVSSRGEVLGIGRATGVADQQSGHARTVAG